MGARLQYAKVVDRQLYYEKGGRVRSNIANEVHIRDEPGEAGAFLVLRGWADAHGTFTEQWRIVGSGGGTIYESVPRELHLPTHTHVERLEDEVTDLQFQYAADDYAVVFTIDENEVARSTFVVRSLADR